MVRHFCTTINGQWSYNTSPNSLPLESRWKIANENGFAENQVWYTLSQIYIYGGCLATPMQSRRERVKRYYMCGVVDILVGSSCYLLFSRTSKGLLNLLDRPFIACRGKLFALLAAKRPKKGAEPEQPSYIKKDHSLHHH